MYVRFTQPPADLFDWYEEYLQDEEEIDVKAGGGQVSNDRFFLLQYFEFFLVSELFPSLRTDPILFQITKIYKFL